MTVQWAERRHQVALAGRVVTADPPQVAAGPPQGVKPVAGARVEIGSMPRELLETLGIPLRGRKARFGHLPPSLRAAQGILRTRTAGDGSFFFGGPPRSRKESQDPLIYRLPAGSYMVVASLPAAGRRYGVALSASVTVQEAGPAAWLGDLVLPETALVGQVSIKDKVSGSKTGRVQLWLEGSPGQALSDKDGKYALAGLESSPRARTLWVAYRGLQARLPGGVEIPYPGDVKEQDLTVELESSTALKVS